MKVERIKKAFVAHGIKYHSTSVIGDCYFPGLVICISFENIARSGIIYRVGFHSFFEAYRYCKKHGLLIPSRRVH